MAIVADAVLPWNVPSRGAFAKYQTSQDGLAQAGSAVFVGSNAVYAAASGPCLARARAVIVGDGETVEPMKTRLVSAVRACYAIPAVRAIMLLGICCCLGAITMAAISSVPDTVWFWLLVGTFGLGMCILPVLRSFDTLPQGSAQTYLAEE